MMHPALPKDPTLSKLLIVYDQAQKWLDHCDDWQEHLEIEDFIGELEVKINEFTESADYLSRCFAAHVSDS